MSSRTLTRAPWTVGVVTGLQGTEFTRAQGNTIRPELLKIGARIRVTVRKVWVSLSSPYPYAQDFARST